MSDATVGDGSGSDDAPSAPSASSSGAGSAAASRTLTAAKLGRYVNYAVLAGLLLLGLVAALQFYLAAGAAISRWVAPEYASLFRALFNLVVLLLAALGVSVQLRRLTG